MTKTTLNSAYIGGDVRAQTFLAGQPTREHLLERASLFANTPTAISVSHILAHHLRSFAEADPTIDQSLQDLSAGAVVVCAGQQPGLFGGPLLGLYKAATVIKLASILKTSGIKAVPLFWNASEDHDFHEANKACFPALPNSQETTLFKLGPRPFPLSLSKQQLTSQDMDAIRTIAEEAGIEDSFLPKQQEDIGSWNTRIMLAQTKGSGLLVCEPHWFSSELVPFRKHLIEKRGDLVSSLLNQTEALADQGFTTPVHFDSARETMLFVSLEQGRTKLLVDQDGFRAGSHQWTKEELLHLLVESPELFSSSVLSRPIAQQFLFPVVSQVAGPTEIGYLAQLMPLFDQLDTQAPLFWPRARFTAIGKRARDLTTTLGISDAALAAGNYQPDLPQDRTTELLTAQIEGSLSQSLSCVDQIKDQELRSKMIDFRRIVMKEWRSTRKEMKRWEKDRRKPITRAVHELMQLLQPRGIPQERLVGVVGLNLDHTQRLLDLVLRILDPMEQEAKLVDLLRNGNND